MKPTCWCMPLMIMYNEVYWTCKCECVSECDLFLYFLNFYICGEIWERVDGVRPTHNCSLIRNTLSPKITRNSYCFYTLINDLMPFLKILPFGITLDLEEIKRQSKLFCNACKEQNDYLISVSWYLGLWFFCVVPINNNRVRSSIH